MKAIITIEQFDNGISLKWKDGDGQNTVHMPAADPQCVVALDRDKETVIGKMIWDDVKNAMNAALTNTVRLEIDYLVFYDEEERHE